MRSFGIRGSLGTGGVESIRLGGAASVLSSRRGWWHKDLERRLRRKERHEAGEGAKGRAMWGHIGLGEQSFYDSFA